MKKVTISLDIERELRYDINAVCELEDRFDVPAQELFQPSNIGLGLIRSLLYIGLKHGGMKFKGKSSADDEQVVGEGIQEHWIDKGRTLTEMMKIIGEAFKSGGVFAEAEEEGNKENPTMQLEQKEKA